MLDKINNWYEENSNYVKDYVTILQGKNLSIYINTLQDITNSKGILDNFPILDVTISFYIVNNEDVWKTSQSFTQKIGNNNGFL